MIFSPGDSAFSGSRRRARASELIEKQNLGIAIDQCQVYSVPPRNLKGSFDAVLTAVSTRDRMIKDALSDENRITNRAAGDATGNTNLLVRKVRRLSNP